MLYLYSSSSPSDALYRAHFFSFLLSPPFFHPLLPSSIPFSPFSFLPFLQSSPLLLFPQIPGTGGGRRLRWWSSAAGVFPLHLQPAAGQQNMYRCWDSYWQEYRHWGSYWREYSHWGSYSWEYRHWGFNWRDSRYIYVCEVWISQLRNDSIIDINLYGGHS